MKMKCRFVLCCVSMLFAGMLCVQAQTPEWQAGVDKVKELIKSDPDAALKEVNTLLKGKNKKNVELIIALARAYWDAEDLDGAEEMIKRAKKADSRSAEAFLLEGDIALSRENVGAATQAYEQAILFDADCYEAYLKYAQAYKSASPQLAIERLNQLLEKAPDYMPAYRTLADVYYAKNDFNEAVRSYEKFIHTDIATEGDIMKYAFALFMNHDFEASLEIANKGLQQNAESATFNRLAMYNYVDMKRYDEALIVADVFFNKLKDVNYSSLDYRYYGALLNEQKQYEAAIEQYEKSLEMDTLQVELLSLISDAYASNNDYEKAIDAYKRYCDALEETSMQNTFQLARLYYGEGTSTDSVKVTMEMRQAALQQADTIFAEVAIQAPESYLGNFWRARTRSAMDPETTLGLAKPYYEKTLEMLLNSDNSSRYRSQIVECYKYLGYYYLLQSDYSTSKDYWSKILELSPNDALAKTALEGIANEGH